MKFFRNHRKLAVSSLALIVAIVAGGAAYAYFTSSGGGSGYAETGTGSTVSISQLTNTSLLYDSLVTPVPQDMFSEAFAATGTSEFGNYINLASSGATLSSVTATLSSWACESGSPSTNDCTTTAGPGDTFPVPVTLSLYAAPATPSTPLGAAIGTDVQTFNVPYRPSEDDANCKGPNLDNPGATEGDANGEWFNGSTCSMSLETNVTFNAADFSLLPSPLPGSLVYGISYPTTSSGESALNVAVSDDTGDAGTTNVTVGSDAITGDFLNSSEPQSYCDNAPAQGVGTFQYDPYTNPCAAGNGNEIDNPAPGGTYEGFPTLDYTTGFWVPAVEFTAYAAGSTYTSLLPGGPAQPVDFTVTNTGTSPAYIQDVTFAITGSNTAGCNLGYYTTVQPTIPAGVTIPVGGSKTFQPSGGSVSMINEPYSQDDCEGAILDLTFTAH
jgi:hypothetical protein